MKPERSPLPLALAAAALLGARGADAAPLEFDFRDPKGVNNVVFRLDAPLEAINGNANGVRGTVRFDPAEPRTLSGFIVVETASMHVPNPVMKEHLHGEQWMDSARHPEIRFEARELRNARVTGDVTEGEMTGTLTLHGVSREMTAPVKVTFLKDKLAARTNGQAQGDLLVLRSTFTLRRSDFGINPGAPQDKVSDTVELTLSVAGAAPRP